MNRWELLFQSHTCSWGRGGVWCLENSLSIPCPAANSSLYTSSLLSERNKILMESVSLLQKQIALTLLTPGAVQPLLHHVPRSNWESTYCPQQRNPLHPAELARQRSWCGQKDTPGWYTPSIKRPWMEVCILLSIWEGPPAKCCFSKLFSWLCHLVVHWSREGSHLYF